MGSPRGYSQQSIAVRPAAPSFGFGTATREVVNKLFISQQHTLIATGGKASPGPAKYELPASVGGKQPVSNKVDPPVWQFGAARRFNAKRSNHWVPSPDTLSLIHI